MTSRPFILAIPSLISILAGKATGCAMPLIVRFPLIFLFSPCMDAALVSTMAATGNFLTSKNQDFLNA